MNSHESCVSRELAPSLEDINQEDGDRCVYAVRLSREVLDKKKFVEENPERNSSMPCLYVGLTAHTPTQRFKKHKADHRASSWVRDHGVELLPRLYAPLNRMSRRKSKKIERVLAEFLREKGYAVWQK